MNIVNAKWNMNASTLKPFFEQTKDNQISIYNSKSEEIIKTNAKEFVNDVFTKTIDTKTDDDKLIAICNNDCLVFTKGDCDWYCGHAKRINKLLFDLSGFALKPAKEVDKQMSKKQTRQLELEEEAEVMSKLRIVAICLKNDTSTIEAYKGTGTDCVLWLNRKLVEHYEDIDTFRICLDLTEKSVLADFKSIDELVNEKRIRL